VIYSYEYFKCCSWCRSILLFKQNFLKYFFFLCQHSLVWKRTVYCEVHRKPVWLREIFHFLQSLRLIFRLLDLPFDRPLPLPDLIFIHNHLSILRAALSPLELSHGIFLLTTASRTALGLTQPPIQWVAGALSLGVKRPGREDDSSPPSSAEVKKWMALYLHSSNTPS
jgi:hypothetical protein